MSKFYDMAYKWSLYEKHCNGFTLAELSEMSGVTDKSLSAWFKQLDLQYFQVGTMNLKTVHRRNAQLRNAFTQKHTELLLLQNEHTVKAIPEIARISCAQRVLLHYGPQSGLPHTENS